MRRLLLLSAALVLVLSGTARADYPAPTGFVVDAAGVLAPAVQTRIEAELRDYSRRTTNQVAVAIVQSLDGETVEDYARTLFNDWGVGTKAKNNGVLLLIALDDRADRVQVGYGLEAVLTDEVAQGVLDDVVTPAAAAEDWGAAARDGERAIRVALHDPRAKLPVGSAQPPATSPFGGGQAQDAPVVDAAPGGALEAPFGGSPGVAVFEDQHRGFPVGLAVAGAGIVGVVALTGLARGRRGGGRVSSTGAAAGTMLYEEHRRHDSSSAGITDGGSFDSGSGSGVTGGGGFGGGSSGDGGASGGW
ncbi:MAG: hypothetical protein JWO12_1908 [Frankiales bacterium]|nr:hypothetical protein [Frankiales bacterium]